ncbi:MAG TPA: hypothetical protein VGP93_03480 [Polyangiaceae bacterium]|jgi:hypothetical protein|nr:hypothetical protein [Polyangiaceae bacterium]
MMMTALSPKARALVQAGRSALRATAADRERVEAALSARLGPSSVPPETGVARFAGRAGWHVVSGAAIGVGLVGGALLLALRPGASAAPAAPTALTAPSAANGPSSRAPTPAPSSLVAPAPVATPSVAAASDAPASPSPREPDRLAQEVTLLSRATSALRAGRAAEALKALDEHQRRFPGGALSEERHAAKAQALCVLGRVSEGRIELSHLTPRSPTAARAKQVCDSASAAAEPP